jgi:FtsP/CotA-like multicopper oxidase with cupredoxin domain
MKRFNCFFPAIMLVAFVSEGAFAVQGTPLPANQIPQFVDPLPVLDLSASGTAGVDTLIAGTAEIELHMRTFKASIMPSTFVPANGLPYTGTWTFGYVNGSAVPTAPRTTPVGPVIVATRGVPTQIRYVNNLQADDTTIHWRDWTDMSMHSAFHQAFGVDMPMPSDTNHYMGAVLAVAHLHGADVPAIIDGGPEAWFASDVPGPVPISVTKGSAYYAGIDVVGTKAGTPRPAAANEAIYRYPNTQEAAPLWFHDHLLGGTRLNATYGGLAGAYALIDPAATLPTGLDPVGLGGRLLVPLVIQDRMFDTNGQLFFPNIGVNPEHPYWVPEFVGDTIVVNGKVWPYLSVDRQRYRFFLVNGSNSRPYDMFLQDQVTGVKGPRMWVISTDGGYLDRPALIDPNATGKQSKAGVQKSLTMMSGERYEIIVDFNDPVWISAVTTAYTAMGQAVPNPLNLVLRNTAATVDGNPKASTEGRIMQFRVSANAPADASYNPDPAVLGGGQPLRQPMVRLANPVMGTLATGVVPNVTRLLTLNEVVGLGGPLEALVNNSKWMGMRMDGTMIPGSTLVLGNYLTELPVEGQTEVWEIVNTTMDSHPIHLHGTQFQLINRQAFDMKAFMMAYDAAFPGGMYMPGYGPPLDYFTGNPRALGGNPDPKLLGAPRPPLSHEAGWKDTVIMHPGEVSRIAVRLAPQEKPINASDLFWSYEPAAMGGAYVWHCHITDHEDNEMMRPMQFQSSTAAFRTYVQGVDY